MKTKNRQRLLWLFLAVGIVSACKKETDNIFTMFRDVHVTFNGNHPLSVTDYKLVNDGDSVYVDYTITSDNKDMYTVVVEKVGGAQGNGPERTNNVVSEESERRSYSRVIKLKMQRDGKTSYRIYALDRFGTYIGDGYNKVTIEVNPSYMVYADRRIYSPDSVEKVLPSFFSLRRAEAFSYQNGQANAADIDFGIWRKVTTVNGNPVYTYNYYSLTASPNPFPIYDISSWQKRDTKFSAPVKGGTNTFLYNLVSASTIEAQAKTRSLNVKSTDYSTPADGLAAGNLVYFLTPEGKYGVLHVNQVTDDLQKRPYLNVSIKIQN